MNDKLTQREGWLTREQVEAFLGICQDCSKVELNERFLDQTSKLCRMALAALNGPPAVEWRPISEAPKDGTWIIGWPKGAEVPSSMHWGEYNDLEMQWCDAAFDGWFENVEHWISMLPKPEEA